ncbi:MAG: penicillin-binding protein 1C, partial [Candidatus Marinimicrobia bacterium]|nr:penicillin-binding protein 1C [Candidatus Neomarinimicrobiota bacterium]
MSKRIIGRMLRGGWRRRGIVALATGGLLAAAGWGALRGAPFPAARLAQYPAAVVLTDRRGEPLRVRLGVNDLDCRPSYVPAPGHWIVRALIAAEDQRFWSHPGLDGLALLRAVRQNVSAGRRISGASTLSTQVIRLVQPRRRTLAAKVIEAFRALQMEQRYSKLDILAQYLNRAPFGGNIVGIEAAAWRYFGKQAADLSLAEAALLAGLPQAPSRLRPDRHPAAARARQAYVLERMQAGGEISAGEARLALAQPLAIRQAHYPFRAPHFTDWAGVPPGLPPGAPAVTTLDSDWQRLAEEVLERRLAGRAITGGAIVLLDVRTGAVRALAGSPDYAAPDGGQYNAALAARGAGSTLKPFVYALALDQGRLSPHSMLRDVPRHYRDYDPTNFDPVFRGVVSVREALVLSLNLPAIEAQDRVGQPRFLQLLRRLGLTTLSRPADHYGTGLVLGNGEVRLLDLVNAYACLARGGAYLPVRAFEALPPPAPRRLFSPEACWLITEMLSGDERAQDATGHAADVRLPRLAWKTGTSAGRRDAWTVAYNPEVVIGVWVGNLDGARSDWLVGRQAATPMVWDIFRRLYPDNQGPWFARPPG